MDKLSALLHRIESALKSGELISLYRTKASAFTRQGGAKLDFTHLVHYLLTINRKSAQVSILEYIRHMELCDHMTKQSLFEAREKLSHRIFADLNEDWLLRDTVYCSPVNTWNGFVLAGVDGSYIDVPVGSESDFGTFKTVGAPNHKAHAISIYDVLNEYIIYANLGHFTEGEREAASKALRHMKKNFVAAPIFYIFDRGYFSRDLARQMIDDGQFFLMRIQNGTCLSEINEANAPDQIITRKDKGEPDLVLRVINVVLPNGVEERLVTNYFDEGLTAADFGELYHLRWGVEIGYLSLKERLQLEDFSSSKKELILQDFFSTILVYNMLIICLREAEEEKRSLSRKSDGKSAAPLKYQYKPNKNVLFGSLRSFLIDAVLTEDPMFLHKLMDRLHSDIEHFKIPVRPVRSRKYERVKKHPSAAYAMNRKRGI